MAAVDVGEPGPVAVAAGERLPSLHLAYHASHTYALPPQHQLAEGATDSQH